MKLPRAAACWLALAGCAAVSGCTAFAPRSDVSRYYFLTPLAPAHPAPQGGGQGRGNAAPAIGQAGGDAAPAVGQAGGHAAPTVGLADVRFPTYLDRPELATRVAANELHFSNVARWAEPLGPGFARVLAVDLDAQLGTPSVVRSPWYATARLDCVLTVEVDHFEPEAVADAGGGEVGTGDAVLVARWTLQDARGTKVLRRGTATYRRPAASTGTSRAATVVAALSELIADFSRDMAAAIRAAVAGDSPGGG